MLQFFKKSGPRERSTRSQSSPTKFLTSETFSNAVLKSSLARPQILKSLGDEENEGDEEGLCGSLSIEISSARSRLSKTLSEILVDKEALGYFIQFMESRGKFSLIKFWMEAECIREASNEHNDFIDNLNQSNSPLSDSNENCLNENMEKNRESVQERVHFQKHVNRNELQTNGNNKESKTRETSNWWTISEEPRELSSIYQDALRIYKKYILKDDSKITEISLELKETLNEALVAQNAVQLINSLLLAQKQIYRILEDEYTDDFLRSDFHCKHQIDVLTSGDVKLADILFNETALFYFIEFMELENKRELLDFWMSAINFKQNLNKSVDPIEAENDALIIYEKFFSLQATKPLGFTDKIRFEVEQNICQEGNNGPQLDCFDKPSMMVYTFLSKHYLPAFLSSQLYYKYLTELISTIQTSTSKHRIKKAGSDCGSELSMSSMGVHDTLHNIEDSNRTASINGSMNIDTRQLYDPDSLWKRNKSSLSVGYVDHMGRFVTEIEPDPHRKYESRLSRAVKRFINMEQDKAKEDLAWKIAEMIVREITSLTLGVSETPS